MSTQMLTLTSISIYMLGMLVIGYFAYKRTSNLTDYMLGGRTLGPAVTALSAGASDMSGWLFGCALAFKQMIRFLALVGYAWAGLVLHSDTYFIKLILETHDEMGRTCWYDFWLPLLLLLWTQFKF